MSRHATIRLSLLLILGVIERSLPLAAQIVAVPSHLGIEFNPPPAAGNPVPVDPIPSPLILFPEELWDSLRPPNKETFHALSQRLPDLELSKVREIPTETAKILLDAAAAMGLSPLELFTDIGLRNDRLYYIPQEVMRGIEKNYIIRSIFLSSGKTVDEKDFLMQHLVMGANRVEMLYNRDDFVFIHPIYSREAGEFRFRSRVTMEIAGASHVKVKNVSVGFWDVNIRELKKRDKLDEDCARKTLEEGVPGFDCVEIVTKPMTKLSALHPIYRIGAASSRGGESAGGTSARKTLFEFVAAPTGPSW